MTIGVRCEQSLGRGARGQNREAAHAGVVDRDDLPSKYGVNSENYSAMVLLKVRSWATPKQRASPANKSPRSKPRAFVATNRGRRLARPTKNIRGPSVKVKSGVANNQR